jgi:tRNA-specific 2-thiouridylase
LFTLGQRHGLGVAAGAPVWVRAIDPATGRVELCRDEKCLLATACVAGSMRWLCTAGERRLPCQVQTRYRQKPVAVTLEPLCADWARVHLRFAAPVRAVTPGQNVVLYAADRVLGGGWIEATAPLPSASAEPRL